MTNFRYKLLKSEILKDYYCSSYRARKYLNKILKNLSIKICAGEYHNILKLMEMELLEGWCHQTSQSAIVFFNDDDYIERGDLLLSDTQPNYHHSWIVFEYKGKEYVFDPCLSCICDKKDYYDVFEIKVMGRATARDVKDVLIDKIRKHKKTLEESNNEFKDLMDKIVKINSSTKLSESISASSVGYEAELKDNNFDKMKAHYYLLS